VGSKRERGLRGGREVGHKTIVGVAVEQRRHTAGSARLAVLEGVSFEEDLGPFLRGAIDADQAAVRTDGFAGYLPLEEAGIAHDRHVQGSDRTRSAKILPWSHTIFSNLKAWLLGTFRGVSKKQILPWSHTIFSNLKAWLLGTFRGVSKKHMPRYLDEFVYRFNRRWREGELFGFVLSRAVRGEPFPYSRLTAELLG
jgi:transposase-like protein